MNPISDLEHLKLAASKILHFSPDELILEYKEVKFMANQSLNQQGYLLAFATRFVISEFLSNCDYSLSLGDDCRFFHNSPIPPDGRIGLIYEPLFFVDFVACAPDTLLCGYFFTLKHS